MADSALSPNIHFDQNYYRSQAQKRLRLAYDYARSDLEFGRYVGAYHLCTGIAGVDLNLLFNRAESNMWHDIRAYGKYLRFYPEYSIGEDYIDFVEPYKKIAIEIDGSLHDPIRDEAKNQRLEAAGYRVIRIPTRYTGKDLEDIWNAIAATEEVGKHHISEMLKRELPLNSEAIIKMLRGEHRPRENVSLEDSTKTITLADVAKTPEFKRYYKKYFDERPSELDQAIEAIPLYKDARISNNIDTIGKK